MDQVTLTIDGREAVVHAGTTILEAARKLDIYIPVLCSHPDLPPAEGGEAASIVYQGERRIENAMPGETAKGCGLCLVSVEGEQDLVPSCSTVARPGMVVTSLSDRIRAKRQENLIPILAHHPHACLTCAQQEGCTRSLCSANVPEEERCCNRFGHCELQDVADYIGIGSSTPRWIPTNLSVLEDQPLFTSDYNLCVGCTRCVRACRDLRGVEALGFVFDVQGRVRIGTLAPNLEESGCRFCTACVEVCPTGALTDKSVRPGKKEEDLVPCREVCPVHMDVPGYLRLASEGKRDEAHAVVREKVPFPGVLGRVCIRPCEAVCRRGEVNEPVAVCTLKRYAADGEKGFWEKGAIKEENAGRKVAIVGAGPAGLSAAFYLRKKGHWVTVFESREKPGGMMQYGIPEYRLPRDVLDKEIQEILDTGIILKTRMSLGKEFTLDDLFNDGFDAVFISVGAQSSRRITMEGLDLQDVYWGVDFLGQVAEGQEIHLQKRVIVVGGGDVAVDAARTARRLGAKEVTIVCLEKREEMGAQEREIRGALEEGMRLIPSLGPRKVLSESGRVTGLEAVHCLSVYDTNGNFAPVFNQVLERLEGDQIIMAVGQEPDLSFLPEGGSVAVMQGMIVVEKDSLETGMEGVYAGGDVTKDPGSVIHAIAAGRQAASSIDCALGGDGRIEEVLIEREDPYPKVGRENGFAGRRREIERELDMKERVKGFEEVSLGYQDDQAVQEAKRCLQCDLRLFMGKNPSPPEKLLAFNTENISRVPEEEGVFRLYDEGRNVQSIKGTPNLQQDLLEQLETGSLAAWFDFEEEKMYSRRESELIQQYLQQHGKMPGCESADLDGLF